MAQQRQPPVHENYGSVSKVSQPKVHSNYGSVTPLTQSQTSVHGKNQDIVQISYIGEFLKKLASQMDGIKKYWEYVPKFEEYNIRTKAEIRQKIKSVSFLTKMDISQHDAQVICQAVNDMGGKCIMDMNEGQGSKQKPRPVPPINNNQQQAAQPEHITKGGPRAPKFIKHKEQNGQKEGAVPNQNKDEGAGALPGHMITGGGVRAAGYLKKKEGNGNQPQPALPSNTKGNGNTPKANAIFDDLYYFEDGYDGYYGYQDGYQGYDGYDNQYGHYISYDNDMSDNYGSYDEYDGYYGYNDLYSFQGGYQGNGGYDNQYGHYISYDDGMNDMNDNHGGYDGVAVFAVGALTGIILLCCVCGICSGISMISFVIGKYLDKYVSNGKLKDKRVIGNDDNRCVESEIDQL